MFTDQAMRGRLADEPCARKESLDVLVVGGRDVMLVGTPATERAVSL